MALVLGNEYHVQVKAGRDELFWGKMQHCKNKNKSGLPLAEPVPVDRSSAQRGSDSTVVSDPEKTSHDWVGNSHTQNNSSFPSIYIKGENSINQLGRLAEN